MSDNIVSETANKISGDELKLVRKKMGLTQAQMAKELGVSRQTIATWEKEKDEWLDQIIFLAVQALTRLPDVRRYVFSENQAWKSDP